MNHTLSPEHQTNVMPQHPHWWLRLSHHQHRAGNHVAALPGLERLQRSRRATWILAGLCAILLLSLPFAFQSRSGLLAVVIGASTLAIATLLNRLGCTTATGVLLVTLISLTVLFVLLRQPAGLTASDLPLYDVLLSTLLVAGLILSFPTTFIVAASNITLITTDIFLQPKAPDFFQQSTVLGPTTYLLTPLALNIATVVTLYLLVHGQNKASSRHISAHAIRDQSSELATAIHTTHELTIIQHYQTMFIEAIAAYITNRMQGITSSITLDFPRPRTQFEERTQMSIATDATRLNQLFRRLDISEQHRRWNMSAFLLNLRHYNYLLSSILHGGDLTLLHPARFGKTHIPLFDATIALVFANVVGSAPGQFLTHSQLPITNETQYAASVRESALIAYQNTMSATSGSATLSPLPFAPFLPSIDNIPSRYHQLSSSATTRRIPSAEHSRPEQSADHGRGPDNLHPSQPSLYDIFQPPTIDRSSSHNEPHP